MTKKMEEKIYLVYKREFRCEDFDGYPVYDSFLDKCFKKKEDAERYCNKFPCDDEEYIDDEECRYIAERIVE